MTVTNRYGKVPTSGRFKIIIAPSDALIPEGSASKYAPTNTGKLIASAAIMGVCHGLLLRLTLSR